MRILSWDVGLKTLSYCLLRVEYVSSSEDEKQDANTHSHQCFVERWETIDVPSEYESRVAAAVSTEPHQRLHDTPHSLNGVSISTLSNAKADTQSLEPMAPARKRATKSVKRSLAVLMDESATGDASNKSDESHESHGSMPSAVELTLPCHVKPAPRKRAVRASGVTKLTLEQSVEAVHQSLARRVSFLLCATAMPDAIIIEQQPAGGHNKFSSVNMKVISHVIQAYFYNLVDSARCTISFVSPASKLVEMREGDRKLATAAKKKSAAAIKKEEQEGATMTKTLDASLPSNASLNEVWLRKAELKGDKDSVFEVVNDGNTHILSPLRATISEITDTTPAAPVTAATRTLMGQRYRRNKQFAVTKTQELISVNELLVGSTGYASGVLKASGKKKDDLCDAFLLGYYYGVKMTT